jgi:hypothetical protein
MEVVEEIEYEGLSGNASLGVSVVVVLFCLVTLMIVHFTGEHDCRCIGRQLQVLFSEARLYLIY